MTAKQFLGWEEYGALVPFDIESRRDDWRNAAIQKIIFDSTFRIVDAILASVGAKKSERPKFIETDLKDFVLEWKSSDDPPKPPRRQQTWQEQWAIVETIMKAYEAGSVSS